MQRASVGGIARARGWQCKRDLDNVSEEPSAQPEQLGDGDPDPADPSIGLGADTDGCARTVPRAREDCGAVLRRSLDSAPEIAAAVGVPWPLPSCVQHAAASPLWKTRFRQLATAQPWLIGERSERACLVKLPGQRIGGRRKRRTLPRQKRAGEANIWVDRGAHRPYAFQGILISHRVAPHEMSHRDGCRARDAVLAMDQHRPALADSLIDELNRVVEGARDVLAQGVFTAAGRVFGVCILKVVGTRCRSTIDHVRDPSLAQLGQVTRRFVGADKDARRHLGEHGVI
eukprot:scaffold241832_cov29-Tisochrysis_lutea.AAC.2